MKISKIDHIGIAVKDLEEALKLYRDILQLEVKGVEEVPDQKVKVAFIPVGESKVELLEPTSGDSPVAKFIEKRGEGIHHLTLRVDNLEKALEEAREAGIRLIDEKPRLGAGGAKIAFLHPKSTGGVLLELCERDG
ncbi:MAG TPA: methylmalonyl-CoA epimerase [Firmicutes bacterium]|nr:methylmalonyl-CoA epimerase [Bacillota bacterium]